VLLQDDAQGHLLIGWSTTQLQPIGTTLTVSIKATPAIGEVTADLTLSVVSSPQALPDTLALELVDWSDLYYAVGPLSPCAPTHGTPPGLVPQAASAYELRTRSVSVVWQPDFVPADVYWEVRLKDALHEMPQIFRGGGASSQPMSFLLFFEPGIEQVCATLTVTDRSTGQVTETQKCQAPQPATSVTAEGTLAYCEAPPSEATVDLWCKLTTPEGTDCNPPAPDPPASRRSKSCQLGPAGGNAGAGPLGLLLLTLARRSRRSARPS
jgi:hypothetical protein